jgi:hypothetical protein
MSWIRFFIDKLTLGIGFVLIGFLLFRGCTSVSKYYMTRNLRGHYVLVDDLMHEVKRRHLDPTRPEELTITSDCLQLKSTEENGCIMDAHQCGLVIQNDLHLKTTHYKTTFSKECNMETAFNDYENRYIYRIKNGKLYLTHIDQRVTSTYEKL